MPQSLIGPSWTTVRKRNWLQAILLPLLFRFLSLMHANMCTHPPGECMQTYQQILIISGMPHHLSDALKYKIVALRECQKSWKEICSILKIKRSTAQAVVKKNAETGDVKNRKSPGRPKKVKPSGQRLISRFIGRNRRATIAQITANYNTAEWNMTWFQQSP
jgi:hypothetical protein